MIDKAIGKKTFGCWIVCDHSFKGWWEWPADLMRCSHAECLCKYCTNTSSWS